MKLSVSAWYPYQHQATAVLQLLNGSDLVRITLADGGNSILDDSFGPFVALIDDAFELPLVGVPAIIEALHRREPARRLLPEAPIARAMARALGGRIEECITRIAIADIESHSAFKRPIWLEGSSARSTILDDYPSRIAVIDDFYRRAGTRYLASDHPSLADCLMAALWWTAEDQGLDAVLAEQPHLAQWHSANCGGAPFGRT